MSPKIKPAHYLAAGLRFASKEFSSKLSELSHLPLLLAPNLVDIQLTLRCNLRCRQCHLWAIKEENELSTEAWKKIILDIRKTVGPYFLRFYGGEPFLRSDLPELLSFCSRHGIFPLLTTNATLIDETLAHRLADVGLACAQISLDGIRARTHDSLRGIPGTYDKVMRAVHLLKGRVPIQINTTILSENLDEILELADWCIENKLPVSFQGVITIPGKDKENINKRSCLFPEDAKKVQEVLEGLCHRKNKSRYVLNSKLHLARLKAYHRSSPLKNKIGCESIAHHLVVRRNGDLWPCPFTEAMGNLSQNSLRDIWRSPRARDKMQEMKRCAVTNCLVMRGCFREDIGEVLGKVRRALFFNN